MRHVPSSSTVNPAASHASGGSATVISSIVTAMPRTLGWPCAGSRGGRGRGPERSGGRHHVRRSRPLGARARGHHEASVEGPGRGAHAARVPHDVCSAIHPLAAASPFFAAPASSATASSCCTRRSPLAHPLDGGRAGVLHRSLAETVVGPGRRRAGVGAPHRLGGQALGRLAPAMIGPLLRVPAAPAVLRPSGPRPAADDVSMRGRSAPRRRRACSPGPAHSFLPLSRPLHHRRWGSCSLALRPRRRVAGPPGGSQAIADAMAARLDRARRHGRDRPAGAVAGRPARLAGRPLRPHPSPARRDLLATPCPPRYRARLGRFRYGPAAWKVDYALSEPVPWTNEACRRPGSVHLGGTLEEIARSEAEVAAGRHPAPRSCSSAQHSARRPVTRAPAGQHTLVDLLPRPNGSDVDMTDRHRGQIERFAPGLPRHRARPPRGRARLVRGPRRQPRRRRHRRRFQRRPAARAAAPARHGPAALPHPEPARLFMCSASTPPGGGVHGMCGYNAAKAALATTLR